MNSSSGYHAAIGKKKKSSKGQKLPAGLVSRMKAPKPAQQELMPTFLSSYGRRRKVKQRGF